MTASRESHKASGNNNQTINVGEIVLIHDDAPRINWRLAIIEELITGNDGLIRAAKLRMASGRTNRPITRLYPLEVTTDPKNIESNAGDVECETTDGAEGKTDSAQISTTSRSPVRDSAKRARERMVEWSKVLTAPPEDVEDCRTAVKHFGLRDLGILYVIDHCNYS